MLRVWLFFHPPLQLFSHYLRTQIDRPIEMNIVSLLCRCRTRTDRRQNQLDGILTALAVINLNLRIASTFHWHPNRVSRCRSRMSQDTGYVIKWTLRSIQLQRFVVRLLRVSRDKKSVPWFKFPLTTSPVILCKRTYASFPVFPTRKVSFALSIWHESQPNLLGFVNGFTWCIRALLWEIDVDLNLTLAIFITNVPRGSHILFVSQWHVSKSSDS